MSRLRGSIGVLLAVALCAGCSRQAPAGAASKDADGAPAAAGGDASGSGGASKVLNIACDKMFNPGDVTAVIASPTKVSTPAQRGTACVFTAADTSMIQVSWDDDMEKALWDDPNQRAMGKYLPTPGLGDEAFAKVSDDGAQIYIKKGGHYCAVTAGINGPKLKGDAMVKQLGGLCDRIFAAAT